MTDKGFQIIKTLILWFNDSMCEKCESKNDKEKCNIETCKKMIKDIFNEQIKINKVAENANI